MNLKYDGLYSSWTFQTTKMVVDKASIPLAGHSISHLVALEVCNLFLVNNNEFCLQLSFVLYDCRNMLKESRRTSNTESVGMAVLHHLIKYHIYAMNQIPH